MTLRDEIAFCADLLGGDRPAAVRRLRDDAPPPAELVTFVQSNQLRPFLAGQLSDDQLRSFFGEAILAALEAQNQRDRLQRGRLLEELARVGALLRAGGVEFLLLKGPHTAARFHGDVHQRHYGDLDLLVHRDQLAAATRILERDGYQRRSSFFLSSRLSAYFTHGFDYRRGSSPLDLHWALGSHVSYQIDYEDLWRRRERLTLPTGAFDVLCDEHALSFHLLSSFEDLGRGALRLKGFVDLDAMLRELDPRLDWPAFLAARDREGLGRICRAVLALFCDTIDCADRFPRLAAAIPDDLRITRAMPIQEKLTLLAQVRGAPSNHVWAAAQYDCSAAVAFGWWAVSLPFRLAVYRPGRIHRIRRKLRALVTGDSGVLD